MDKMKKNQFISIVLATFILVGCGTPAGNTYIAPQQISDPQIAEITPTFEIQIERINNCDSANPTYNVSYKTIETQKASFEVSVGAGGLVTGTPVPSVLEVQLEAKITAALAKDYGLTTEKNHDITLENPKGSYLEHTIEWKVTRVKGLIDVIYGDGVAQVAFDKIANVELYNRTSKALSCDGSGATTLPSTSESVPQVTELVMPDVPLYDDFESDTIDSNKWGQPVWGNPEQYIPIQSQGALHFEISKEWFDWAVNGFQPIEEMYALVTVDSGATFGISLRILASPGSGYNLMLQKDKALIWNDPKELGDFQVSGTCCTHLLGAKVDGEQIYFFVDNVMLSSYPLKGYPDYGTLQIVGSQAEASAQEVWIKFKP